MQNNFRHGWQIPGKIGDWLDIHIEVYFSIFLGLTSVGGLPCGPGSVTSALTHLQDLVVKSPNKMFASHITVQCILRQQLLKYFI